MGAPKQREDVLTTTSNKAGARGFAETILRRFRTLSFLLVLTPLVLICALSIGVSAAPGLWLFQSVSELAASWPPYFKFIAIGCAFSLGYFSYGITLIFVVPIV